MPGTKVQKQKSEGNRAAIYARVSDKSQDAEDKTSIAEQTSEMEAYCEQRGLTIVARYQEVGQGWSKKRSQFQKMLNDAKLGRFDTIVCWKSDRLSRGMYPAAALMEVVEASHVNLEAVMDSIDMKTFGLMAAIGKIELDNFRERSSMGKRGTAKAGRIPVSNVPYGYRVGENGRPEIVEEEAEVVRRIYRWCVDEGLGATVIRNRLTAEGALLGRAGKRWWDGQIHRILTNETYKGTWWYGRARYVSTEDGIKVYEQDPENWIGVPSRPSSTRRPGTAARRCGPNARPIRGATPRYSTCCSTWCVAPSAGCSWAAWPPGSGRSSTATRCTSTRWKSPAATTSAMACSTSRPDAGSTP